VTDEAVDYLSVDDLLEIATEILSRLEVRDPGLLAAASERPRASVFGSDAYPTFPEKVAALLHSLARNDPLVDGNRRLAWAAARVFCLVNGRDLALVIDEAEGTVLGAAAGTLDVPALADIVARSLRDA
jgi:death-on-curing protein